MNSNTNQPSYIGYYNDWHIFQACLMITHTAITQCNYHSTKVIQFVALEPELLTGEYAIAVWRIKQIHIK